MTRKVCKTCGKRRNISKFRKNGVKFRATCRTCEYKQRKERLIVVKQHVLNYLRKHPCVDCGENDPVVLEFDHVSGTKHKSIADLLSGSSWSIVKREIDKCEVRCANCHRIKTAKEFNYWIYEQEYGSLEAL